MNIIISTASFKQEFVLDFKMACRELSFILPTLLFPVLFYVFFGLLFNDLGGAGGGQSATYLLVSYGVFGVMSPALFGFGASVAAERDKGWLAIKQVAPVPASQFILAKLLNSLLFSLIIMVVLFMLATVFGGVVLTLIQWLSLAALLLMGSLPFCALGLAVGFWVKGNAAVAILNVIFLPSAFLSGLAIPVFMFPAWLQQLAYLLPPFHLSQIGLKIIEMDLGQSLLGHVVMLVIFSTIFVGCAVKGYQRMQSH
ncbi:MAG: ABC transporter permease [Gammaproteobacteria bacterium]|nr:ABC transporter permease [Gammaproteobacteria bacterium]